jgi:hypothetical protein
MNRKLIEKIKELFKQKLNAKTGWGKNEVLQLHNDAVNESVLWLLDEEIDNKNN